MHASFRILVVAIARQYSLDRLEDANDLEGALRPLVDHVLLALLFSPPFFEGSESSFKGHPWSTGTFGLQ